MVLNQKVHQYINLLEDNGLLRTRAFNNANTSNCIAFDTNDYLSLTSEPKIRQYYQEGYNKYPFGSTGSMYISGYHDVHRDVERAFADFLNVDACILCPSGYSANLAVMFLLAKLDAYLLIDKRIHASIYDGCHVAGVRYSRYQHNDLLDLTQKIATCRKYTALITEGIFSMSGQCPPLHSISTVCKDEEIAVLVDEAHSFGLLGSNGRGAVDHYALSQNEIPLRVIPLGKAFAAQGAIIAGKAHWVNAVLQAGRSIIYTTAISPALSYGLLKTLDIVAASDSRRAKLFQLVSFFRECIKNTHLNWMDSHSPIQFLQLGCPRKALDLMNKLFYAGFSCTAIRSPTVSTLLTGVRVVINYRHTEEQISRLIQVINDYKY